MAESKYFENLGKIDLDLLSTISTSYDNTPSEELLKLCKYDGRILGELNVSQITPEILISSFKNTDPEKRAPASVIRKIYNDKELTLALIEKIENDFFSQEELSHMLAFEIDRKIIYSDLFNAISKKVCENLGIEHDFFKYHIERAMKLNKEILMTLNLSFLKPEYRKIYEANGYEKLYTLALHPEFQKTIIDISQPIDINRTINYELGSKYLSLLSDMLQISVLDETGKEVENWPYFYRKIINSFGWYTIIRNDKLQNNGKVSFILSLGEDLYKLIDDVVEHRDKLSPTKIHTLTNYILGNHSFKLTTITDLENYEMIRQKWIEDSLASNKIEDVKDAIFEQRFGISYTTAKKLYQPYYQDVFKSSDQLEPSLVDLFTQIGQIMDEDNLEILKASAKEQSLKIDLSEKRTVIIRDTLRKHLVKQYNATLYHVENKKPSGYINKIKVYKAAGEDGKESFNISLSALGAYREFNPNIEGYNYKDDWNRALIKNHGICTSYVGNNNLGTAKAPYSILGFNNYEANALLLSAPYDMYSDNSSFDTIGDEEEKSIYLPPSDMIDSTRHTHNEMVFDRLVDNDRKRQPSYVVLICDNYDKLMEAYKNRNGEINLDNDDEELIHLHHTIKTAEDFNLPIVVIEREKIAQNEYDKLMKKLTEFNDEKDLNRRKIQKYFHDLITEAENNYAGNREYHNNINDQYFNISTGRNIMTAIIDKFIDIKDDKKLGLIYIEELEFILKKEQEKQVMQEDLFDYKYLLSYCQNEKKDLKDSLFKSHIYDLFDGLIPDNASLMESDNYYSNNMPSNQYSITEIKTFIDEETKDKVIETLTKLSELPSTNLDDDASINTERLVLLSGIIGNKIGLSQDDINLLLTVSLYQNLNLSNEDLSSQLKDDFSIEELKIIQATILYLNAHKTNLNDTNLDNSLLTNICTDLNMNVDNEHAMTRLSKIIFCLKDANTLNDVRVEEYEDSSEILRQLTYEDSQKMLKFSERIKEHYAEKEVMKIINQNHDFDSYAIINKNISESNSLKIAFDRYKKEQKNNHNVEIKK